MLEELLEAVKKNLPQMQVELLRQEFKKAEEFDGLIKEKERLLNEKRQLQDSINSLTTQLVSLKQQMKPQEELEKRERDLQLTLVNNNLKAEQDKNNQLRELMYAAFRNPTVNKSFIQPFMNQQTGYMNTGSGNETTTVE